MCADSMLPDNRSGDKPPQYPNPAIDFNAFLRWEAKTRDTLDIKKTYIDMAGDLVAGVLLSQIVYWYLPSKDGKSKITIHKNEKEWIAKSRHEWWDECRVSPKQVDRALRELSKAGIVETKIYKFNGYPTKHIRIMKDKFLTLWNGLVFTETVNPFLPKGQKRFTPNGKNDLPQTVKTLTETTTETTSENTQENKDSTPIGAGDKESVSVIKHTDLIKAWLDETQTIDPVAYRKKPYHDLAKAMLEKNITPDNVQGYIRDKRQEKYWSTRAIPFGTVAAEIMAWKNRQPAYVEPEPVLVDHPARPDYPYSPWTEEQHQQVDDAIAEALRKMAG